MSFEFELFDLISLVTILLGLAATYWKIVARLQITEIKVETQESEFRRQETQQRYDIKTVDGRIEKRLENIEKKIDEISTSVHHLEASK